MKFCMAVLVHASVINISSMLRPLASRERRVYRRQSQGDGETAKRERHEYLLGEELECRKLCSDYSDVH